MPDLSPQQFPTTLYHGTVHALEGDTLVPGKRSGATSGDPNRVWGQSRHDVVSATADEGHAWHFAQISDNMSTDRNKGRQRVHVLEPHPETRVGIENKDHPDFPEAATRWRSEVNDRGEHVAPSFRVKETLDIKPGAQGTFSELNWNQFKRPLKHKESSLMGDANHPPVPYRSPYERPKTNSDPVLPRASQLRLGREMLKDHKESVEKNNLTLF